MALERDPIDRVSNLQSRRTAAPRSGVARDFEGRGSWTGSESDERHVRGRCAGGSSGGAAPR